MNNNFKSNSDKLEFRQIVLEHVKQILQISIHELRQDSKTQVSSHYTIKVFEEDTRKSYIQAIENLAYVTLPYFDDSTKKVYDDTIEIITGFDFEIIKKFKEEYDNTVKEVGDVKMSYFAVLLQLRYAKKLFIEINQLLKRLDYLKSGTFGENKKDEDETFVEDSDEDEESEE